jgi:hypothetical protein
VHWAGFTAGWLRAWSHVQVFGRGASKTGAPVSSITAKPFVPMRLMKQNAGQADETEQ